MKRLIWIGLPLALLLAILTGIAKFGLVPRGTPLDYFAPESAFVREWRAALESSQSPDDALTKLGKNKEGGEVVRMADGTWVAVVMEHECCTGAGFNATLYVTSKGKSYLDADTCYCGFFLLGRELQGHDNSSIDAFLTAVRASGKPLAEL